MLSPGTSFQHHFGIDEMNHKLSGKQLNFVFFLSSFYHSFSSFLLILFEHIEYWSNTTGPIFRNDSQFQGVFSDNSRQSKVPIHFCLLTAHVFWRAFPWLLQVVCLPRKLLGCDCHTVASFHVKVFDDGDDDHPKVQSRTPAKRG